MSPTRIVAVCVVGALAVVPACTVMQAGAADSSSTNNVVPDDAETGGDAGEYSDEGIKIEPPVGGSADPYKRYAALCGDGCTPGGDPVECAQGGDSGAGGAVEQVLHCRLVPGEGGVAAPRCAAVGSFAAGGPCLSGADCAAGFGCVESETGGGVCRAYCCGNLEACAPTTYCSVQTMFEPSSSARIPIPVCVPATNCELLSDASSCTDGLTCTIVREDGTTSCVEPGEGRSGEACPCAPGFVCSMLTDQCRKLCRTGNAAEDCGADGKCQGGSMGYPTGFGVCVGE